MTAAGPTVGIDIGGTKALGVRLAPDGAVLAERERDPRDHDPGPHRRRGLGHRVDRKSVV